MKRTVALLVLAFSVLAVAPARAQPDALAEQLRTLITKADLGPEVGVHVMAVESGATVFDANGSKPLHPASNAKLLTAFTALASLGPAHRFRTAVYGEIDGTGTVPFLFLVGEGDPSLTGSDLAYLARVTRDRGVRKVGLLGIDATAFDNILLPPGFEEQPEEHAPFRCAVGALAIDRAAYELDIEPNAESGKAATVRSNAPGYVVIDGAVATTGGAPHVDVAETVENHKLHVVVRGSVPLRSSPLHLRRRVEDPRWHAAWRFAEALRRVGISFDDSIGFQATPKNLPLLASRTSRPLGVLVQALGKDSDNFSAEMLLKATGRGTNTPGSTAAGLTVVEQTLRARRIPVDALHLVNGSGLFGETRVSPRTLTTLLAHAAQDPELGPEYIAQLAVAGRDGTLAGRLSGVPPGRVRAKTGTLRNVVALSGYVLDARAKPTFAFSVLANGVDGRIDVARQLADDIARALVAASDRR